MDRSWTEFGSEDKSVMEVVRALYGLKTSGASWRAMLAQSLSDIGFVSTKADPDVYLRPATKPCGFEYYEMMLVYVDGILHLSHDISPTETALNAAYRLKEGSIGEPDRYLGANINKYMVDGTPHFGKTCEDYVELSIKNVELMLINDGDNKGLSMYGKKASYRPFPPTYRPECDVSPELGAKLANRYLQPNEGSQ